jgi:hypothetical protein
MFYSESDKVIELKRHLQSFMDRHVYPNEERYYKQAEELGPWKVYPVVEELKPKAREEGLWNLFLPQSDHGAGLTHLEYAPLLTRQVSGFVRPNDLPRHVGSSIEVSDQAGCSRSACARRVHREIKPKSQEGERQLVRAPGAFADLAARLDYRSPKPISRNA